MTLHSRLDKLAQRTRRPDQRCPTCRDWRPTRVVYRGPAGDPPPPPDGQRQPPEACPACGWQPLTIEVVYTTPAGWRDLT